MGCGVALGVGPGLGALIFLGVVNGLTELVWPEDPDPSLLGGDAAWSVIVPAFFGQTATIRRCLTDGPDSRTGAPW